MMDTRQSQLREVFARHSTPFAYGGADCVTMARDAMETLTGRPLNLPVWHDEASAAAVIARYGSLHAAVAHVLGTPATAPAQDGDVVLVRSPDGTEMCGVWAAGRPCVRARNGVVPMPARWATAHWRTS